MHFRRSELRKGDQVFVPDGNELRLGEIQRIDDSVRPRRAEIRFDDGTRTRVETYLLKRPPTHRKRWWWPADLGHRLALIGLPFVVIAGIAAAITFIDSGSGRTPAGSAPATAASTTQTPALTLSTTMLAYDTVWGKRWGDRVKADATDPLKFSLTVENTAANATPDLDLNILYSTQYPTSSVVAGFQIAGSTAVELGSQARISPWSAFGDLRIDGGSARVVDQRGRVARVLDAPLQSGGAQLLPGLSQAALGQYDLGVLAPHERLIITFSGVFSTPDSAQLGGGSLIRFRSTPSPTYQTTGAAHAGERLPFAIRLHDVGYRPVVTHLRLKITPDRPAKFVKIAVIVSEYGEKERTLGYAIVNAKGNQPISLSVVPRTTLFRTSIHRWSCYAAPRVIAHLQDGLEEGGLDLPAIGGFRPRDPCHGSEFTRFVSFTMQVL